MRVQDPAKYAEVLLNIARPQERWTAARIKSMFGSAERDITLPAPIWVHLTYQTAFVDNAGKLQMRRDLYNLDSRTLGAIKHERGVVGPSESKPEQRVSSGSGSHLSTAFVDNTGKLQLRRDFTISTAVRWPPSNTNGASSDLRSPSPSNACHPDLAPASRFVPRAPAPSSNRRLTKLRSRSPRDRSTADPRFAKIERDCRFDRQRAQSFEANFEERRRSKEKNNLSEV